MIDELVLAQTEPLYNGDPLPEHAASTTALRVVKYNSVIDADNHRELHGGLHNNELSILMNKEKHALGHLYFYAIRNGRIYHTREKVVIEVLCTNAD